MACYFLGLELKHYRYSTSQRTAIEITNSVHWRFWLLKNLRVTSGNSGVGVNRHLGGMLARFCCIFNTFLYGVDHESLSELRKVLVSKVSLCRDRIDKQILLTLCFSLKSRVV